MLNCLESEVYNKRDKLGINRVYKLVDTCSAEFPAQTPYYYSTFENGKQVFNGCELLVTFGGPNISIDTRYNLVSGYWGSDRVEFTYSDNDDLYSYFEEIFNSSI